MSPDNYNKRDLRLIEAVRSENVRNVNKLLEAGANPNTEASIKRNQYELYIGDIVPVLALACLFESFEMAQCLLDHGADVDAKCKMLNTYPGDEAPTADEEATALSVVAYLGNMELFDLLLSRGADPDFKVNRWGGYETPLIGAVKSGNKKIVQRLLELGVRVNIINISPLRAATRYYDFGIFQLLFENGCRFHEVAELKEARKVAKQKNRNRLLAFLDAHKEEEMIIDLWH